MLVKMNSVKNVKPQGQGELMGSLSSHAICQRRQSREQSAELTTSGSSSHLSGEEFVPRMVVWEGGLNQVQEQHSLTHKKATEDWGPQGVSHPVLRPLP